MTARSGILGLGSRLYPGNTQRIFNKDLTRFMQSLSREHQNRASKRKALLAGWKPAKCRKKYFPNHFLPEHKKRRLSRAFVDVAWPCSRVEPQKEREKLSLVYAQV